MDDNVFVFFYRDNWFIKRLFRNPTGGLRVVSDNPDKTRYPDWFIEPEQMTEFQVIAKVLAVSGIVE
jgi:phage repressor protein C with HTH and peptisase S24 domain